MARDRANIPSAQVLRDQLLARTAVDRLHPSGSRQSPSDYDYSSPSNYPSPSPGLEEIDDSSRPESSAQAAARFNSNSPSLQSRPVLPQSSVAGDPAPYLSEPHQYRPVEYTHDTFGRTSGKSAFSEGQDSSTTRRKTSPTERGAFSYLASSSNQATLPPPNQAITEYLNQGSVRSPRQKVLDALDKELNLSASSSPSAVTSSLDDGSWQTEPSAGSDRQYLHPTSIGTVRSSTPDRTFGRPSNDRIQTTTHSSGSKPSQDQSRPSRSETTSSQETDQSRDAAYGVGEAGGDHQFSALTRTLTPNQRHHQAELDRIYQQSHGLDPSASAPTALSPRLSSPSSAKAAQRASHQSNATMMVATTTTATSASVASSSTPRHDARLSRQTQETTSSGAARPLSSSDQHGLEYAYGQRPLFVGEGANSGSQDSIGAPENQVSPQLGMGSAPARSTSVRVKTPMFGNTLTELPPEQRASMRGALYERANEPFSSPSQPIMHGAFVNFNQEQEPEHHRAAQYDSQQTHVAHQAKAPTSHGHEQQSQPADPQYHGKHEYYMQPAHHQAQTGFADFQRAGGDPDDTNRTPHLPSLGDMYAAAPKFPPAPYRRYRILDLSSRLARMHHTVLPILTYAHIPATLFLDYNVTFALVQIALYPDDFQNGTRTAWWIAVGIYSACVLAWLVGVVIIYEWLWSYRRRWTVTQPLIMPVFLSSPAFVRTAIKDYSLYSLLYRARSTGNRRDALIELCWHYSQNWPTILTLLPRGVISAILIVLYKPSGPARPTQTPRDPAYFDAATQRLTQFAFILITFQAAWVAWKLAVLLIANIGLAATIGFKGLVQQEQDRNALADTEMTSFYGQIQSRRSLIARQRQSQQAGLHQDGDAIQQATHRRWAWRWRAEDRIRAILFDAGLLHQLAPTPSWRKNQEEEAGFADEHAGDRTFELAQAYPTTYGPEAGASNYDHQDGARDWYGQDHASSQLHTGIALTAPEAVPPEQWAAGHPENMATAAPVAPQPTTSQGLHVQHLASPPSDDGGHSDASDPYSPAPVPIGRSPRSKEQLRDASSISSRNGRTSMRAASISSLKRLAALNMGSVGSNDSPQMVQSGAAPVSSHPRIDDIFTSPARLASGPTGEFAFRSEEPSGSREMTQVAASDTIAGVPQPAPSLPASSSNDTGLLGEWRGRKRPRSSPMLGLYPILNPDGMVTETEDWLREQIDEEEEETEQGDHDSRRDAPASSKPNTFDNDRRIMHTFVPMPASFAMAKDPSLGSPEQGGGPASDTKHGSWPAGVPNSELFGGKPAGSISTPLMRQQADGRNASSTSLGSSLKGGRSSFFYSRPRSSGHGHEVSSEDVSVEGTEVGKQRGRNSLLSRMTVGSSPGSKRRSGSADKSDNESWIAALFGVSTRKKASSRPGSSSQMGEASSDSAGMQAFSSTPPTEMDPRMEGVPMVITTSSSTVLPTGDHETEPRAGAPPHGAGHDAAPESSLLAPTGSRSASGGRSSSPSGSERSNVSGETDDSEEGRLWASFPEQTRRHPPGLIALDLEQRSLAERRLAAAASENNAAMEQHRLLYGGSGGASSLPIPGLSGNTGLNLSPLMHPNVLAAVSQGSGLGLPGVLGGAQLSISPSEGGLHAIREESWTSSLDSRSQGATGSTRSRGTASALTASPLSAEFPLEQIEEVAVPRRQPSSTGAALRRRDST